MDWRESGEILKAEIRGRYRELGDACASAINLTEEELATLRVQSAVLGNRESVSEILRSDLPLADASRELLAAAFAGRFVSVGGRPSLSGVRLSAIAAKSFFSRWREFNRQNGIRDHGVRGEMCADAVRFIVEELEPPSPPPDDLARYCEDVLRAMRDTQRLRR